MKVRFLIIPILLVCLLISCSMLGIGTDTTDFTKMTGKQKATFFMGVYNRQYADYKVQVALPNLTDDQKKVLTQRKAILIQVYPLVQTFDLMVASGQTPGREQEQAIMALLNQLGTYIK